MEAKEFVFGKGEVFLNSRFQVLEKYKLNGMYNCQIEGPALIFS